MFSQIKNIVDFKNLWVKYWFSNVSSAGFGIFRIAFGLVLFIFHLPRLFYIRELYTSDGFLAPLFYFNYLSLPIPNFTAAVFLNVLLILAICSFILGFFTRTSTLVVLLSHTYLLLLENFSTKAYGNMMIIYLILSLFAPLGSFLSFDFLKKHSWHFKFGYLKDLFLTVDPPRVSITMQRVMLWQLSSIYFFNFVAKLNYYKSWFSGDALLNLYLNTDLFGRPFVFPLISRIPFIFPVLSSLAILAIGFIAFGLLFSRTRIYAIMLGILYHSIVLFTTNVVIIFAFLMYALYCIAVEPAVWERWWQRFRINFIKK